MYPTVPSTLPGCVATSAYEPVSLSSPGVGGVSRLARPKSRILTTPSCGRPSGSRASGRGARFPRAWAAAQSVRGPGRRSGSPSGIGGGPPSSDLPEGLSVDGSPSAMYDTPSRLSDIEDGDDVGMVQEPTLHGLRTETGRGRSASPAIEAGRTLMASSRWRRGVARPVNLAHAPRSEWSKDLVGAEPRPGSGVSSASRRRILARGLLRDF